MSENSHGEGSNSPNQAIVLQSFVEQLMITYPDSIHEVANGLVPGEIEHILAQRTANSSTILAKLARREGEAARWSLQTIASEVEGFVPERLASAGVLADEPEIIGGVLLPGTFDQYQSSDTLVAAIRQDIQGEPMSRAETEDFLRQWGEAWKRFSEEGKPFLDSDIHDSNVPSGAFQLFTSNYAERRTAARQGRLAEVPRLQLEDLGVRVVQIPRDEAVGTVKANLTPINSKESAIETMVDQALQGRQARSEEAFLLMWRGGRIPRGAMIGENLVKWTQHGQVIAASGRIIGTYVRLEDGYEVEREKSMLVFSEAKLLSAEK